ncbi:MAG: hypothetical protein LC635_04465 [Pseudonocardiaceae bacterium]|nr:hypothetical protein [Pseudonocardiaceae bacterium]
MRWFARRARRGVAFGMKYYVYISDTKVDMLFAQVPRSFVAKVAAELTVDLKVITISLKERPSDEGRYSKVKVVSDYLRANLDLPTIGDGNAPTQYFAGELDMRWGISPTRSGKRHEQVAYFTGRAPGYLVSLVGSPHHVLGQPPRSTVGATTASFGMVDIIPDEMSQLTSEDGELRVGKAGRLVTSNAAGAAMSSVQMLEHYAYGSSQPLEFLAKTLAYEDGHDIYVPSERTRLISVLGSPIYVATA